MIGKERLQLQIGFKLRLFHHLPTDIHVTVPILSSWIFLDCAEFWLWQHE